MAEQYRVIESKGKGGASCFTLQSFSIVLGRWLDLITRKGWDGLRLGAMAWYKVDIAGIPVIPQGVVNISLGKEE